MSATQGSNVEVLIDQHAIADRIRELGMQITHDFDGKSVVLVGILKGAVPFLVDLMRAIDLPVALDFLQAASYGASTQSSGEVRLLKELTMDIEGKHVVVVEDIIDTGHTLSFLLEHLKKSNPASLSMCTLLDKPSRRLIEVAVDYVGFTIEDKFVVGFGLDLGERFRNLPFVGVYQGEVP